MKCGRIGNWGRRGFPAVCALTRQKVWGSSRYGGHKSNSASGQKQSGGVALNFSICMHGAHGSSFIVEAFQYRSMRGIQTLNSSVLSVFELELCILRMSYNTWHRLPRFHNDRSRASIRAQWGAQSIVYPSSRIDSTPRIGVHGIAPRVRTDCRSQPRCGRLNRR